MTSDQAEKKGFDFVVSHRDPKTGLVVSHNPYTMRVLAAGDGGRTRVYERPVGSGNLWDKKGNPVGRWIEGEFKKDAEHIAFAPPETKDQKLSRALNEKESRIAELEKELAAIKTDAKKKEKGA